MYWLRIIMVAVVVALIDGNGIAKDKKPEEQILEWGKYSVSTKFVGQDGTKILKVWSTGKTVEKAVENAVKNAVYASLFRGIPGSAEAMETPAIFCNNGNEQALSDHFEYFLDFFEKKKEYVHFINLISNGLPSDSNRREIKGGFKVGVSVQVMYDNLREKMKRDGILKSFSSEFKY